MEMSDVDGMLRSGFHDDVGQQMLAKTLERTTDSRQPKLLVIDKPGRSCFIIRVYMATGVRH